MSTKISQIKNDVQDRSCLAWKKLCEYVEVVARENKDEFSPFEFLGQKHYSQIHTLPETIYKLKNVKKMWLYGSKLKRIPPEIGEMTSLEYFDPYTSYRLHWFPFEITNCRNLKDSRVSTRALYGNFKNRMRFPSLEENPVTYFLNKVYCSICKKESTYSTTNQLWISLSVGTDVLPLLVNLCSKECESKLPKAPEPYLQYAHKGGPDLNLRGINERTFLRRNDTTEPSKDRKQINQQEPEKEFPLYNIIRKIWER